MPKNIVVCADGTWNRPTAQTHVWKLFSALPGTPHNVTATREIGHYLYKDARAASPQIAYYLQGVGTRFSRSSPTSGAVGAGLHNKVLDGYLLISRVYQPGDNIYLFGFSRGAFTARSLAGFIAKAGLMPADDAQADNCRSQANDIWWDFKRKAFDAPRADAPDAKEKEPIRLVGVWDTVGALGVPFFNGVTIIEEAERQLFDFADNVLSSRVANGRHAVAVDEKRRDFEPTLWVPRTGIDERWFAGVHSDVGGGYPSRGLSDIALKWMLDDAMALGLVVAHHPPLNPDPRANRHESCSGFWNLRSQERVVPGTALLDQSVIERLTERDDYRPRALIRHPQCRHLYQGTPPPETLCAKDPVSPFRPLEPGQSMKAVVSAERWWNGTGVSVKTGERYRIAAEGTWHDDDVWCNAEGWVGLPWLVWTRRVRGSNWFHLCAAVSGRSELELKAASFFKGLFWEAPQEDAASDIEPIGCAADILIKRDGCLYLFANDAPPAYGNNSGCIEATITRLA
jgi:uncharacterized protein (DUF2235 family)